MIFFSPHPPPLKHSWLKPCLTLDMRTMEAHEIGHANNLKIFINSLTF